MPNKMHILTAVLLPLVFSILLASNISVHAQEYNDKNFLWNLEGAVYNDQNENNQKDDLEENISDWEIRLYSNTWDLVDTAFTAEPYQVSEITSQNAHYHFSNLSEGEYYICQVLQEGWNQTYPTANHKDEDDYYQISQYFDRVEENISGHNTEGSPCWKIEVDHQALPQTSLDFGIALQEETTDDSTNKTVQIPQEETEDIEAEVLGLADTGENILISFLLFSFLSFFLRRMFLKSYYH